MLLSVCLSPRSQRVCKRERNTHPGTHAHRGREEGGEREREREGGRERERERACEREREREREPYNRIFCHYGDLQQIVLICECHAVYHSFCAGEFG